MSGYGGNAESAVWQKCETFGGDVSYMSPIFTYGGVAEIFLDPSDCEGAAIALRVAGDLRSSTVVDLTIAEARSLARWLIVAANEMEDAP